MLTSARYRRGMKQCAFLQVRRGCWAAGYVGREEFEDVPGGIALSLDDAESGGVGGMSSAEV